jgi:vitamin B12 transporter
VAKPQQVKKNYTLVAAGLGFAQLALFSTAARSQEKPATQLQEVVVTASRSPKKQSEIGKVVRVINSEQLSRSQGRTLPEVLNNVAGLNIGGNNNTPGDIKSVYLRGASAGNTLILIDGIPVNDASNISGEFDISAIVIDQIERIEILKGGNSTLYGSDAVAGVINIITKRGGGKLKGNVLGTVGSYDTYKGALGLNGSVGNTSIGLNVSNSNSKGFSTAIAPNGDKDGLDQKSLSLNLRQQVNSNVALKGNLQLNNNQAGLDNGPFSDKANYVYDKTALLAGLGAEANIGNSTLNLTFSQNNIKNIYDNAGSITNNRGEISNVDAVLTAPLASFLDLTSGGNFKYSATDQRSPFGSLNRGNHISSVFTSLFFKTEGGFRAEIGGRYNNHSAYGDNVTYTVNPSYVFAEKYKVFVNVSSAYKVPSIYQLYSQYGNLNLKPETSRTYEAGFDFDVLDNLNLNFSYFQRDVEDAIDFGAVSPTRFGYINQNQQNDHGFEAELSVKPSKILSANFYYAYVTGKIATPTTAFNNLFRRPKNSAGANIGLQLGNKANINLNYKLTGKRIDRYFDSNFNQVDAELKSYNLVDTYLQYKPASKLALFADIKNIFNEDYIEFSGYNTRGRNFNAGFKLDLN